MENGRGAMLVVLSAADDAGGAFRSRRCWWCFPHSAMLM